MPAVSPQSFRFGQFELDPASGELRRGGRRRRLQAQPFKLLVLLIRRAGAIVTYDEIRGELWGEDTFVEFDQAVHYAVRQIREALGDSADQPPASDDAGIDWQSRSVQSARSDSTGGAEQSGCQGGWLSAGD